VEIDAASQRGINDVKALRQLAHYAPYGEWRLFLLDEAHALTGDAANALLKTLEEPPPRTVFVLATTAPEKMVPTILSRCQRYRFLSLAPGDIVKVLRRVVEGEGIAADEAALITIAEHAGGSVRDALTLLEQLSLVFSPITVGDVEDFLGVPPKQVVVEFLSALDKKDARKAFALLETLHEHGYSYSELDRMVRKLVSEVLIRRALSGSRVTLGDGSGGGDDGLMGIPTDSLLRWGGAVAGRRWMVSEDALKEWWAIFVALETFGEGCQGVGVAGSTLRVATPPFPSPFVQGSVGAKTKEKGGVVAGVVPGSVPGDGTDSEVRHFLGGLLSRRLRPGSKEERALRLILEKSASSIGKLVDAEQRERAGEKLSKAVREILMAISPPEALRECPLPPEVCGRGCFPGVYAADAGFVNCPFCGTPLAPVGGDG
jgi:hypothetical protein